MMLRVWVWVWCLLETVIVHVDAKEFALPIRVYHKLNGRHLLLLLLIVKWNDFLLIAQRGFIRYFLLTRGTLIIRISIGVINLRISVFLTTLPILLNLNTTLLNLLLILIT